MLGVRVVLDGLERDVLHDSVVSPIVHPHWSLSCFLVGGAEVLVIHKRFTPPVAVVVGRPVPRSTAGTTGSSHLEESDSVIEVSQHLSVVTFVLWCGNIHLNGIVICASYRTLDKTKHCMLSSKHGCVDIRSVRDLAMVSGSRRCPIKVVSHTRNLDLLSNLRLDTTQIQYSWMRSARMKGLPQLVNVFRFVSNPVGGTFGSFGGRYSRLVSFEVLHIG